MKTLPLVVSCASVWLGVLGSPAPAGAESLYGDRQAFWQMQLGVRSMVVTDPGFDPFATNDVLAQFSLGLSRTVWDGGAFSFAPGIVWDYGQRGSTARGQGTDLNAHRLALALEGRYHLWPWAYGLVRVSPGAIHQAVEVQDPLSPAPFVESGWGFALDASAGAVFLLGPQSETTASPVRWWLGAEGGYSYADKSTLLLHPDLAEDDPRRVGSLDLGTLALRGGFFRVYGSVTY